ncbi:glycosyltransferase [Paraliobacillus ryukyuensis]|uniref:glycosyltransferase n=1 Tax=Paraliobacillus ryukyuensis TaxID=200904 RepID=UPI0009A68364|nr:glycosyltransferase [Paraliobacillus ryukyuensis]
MGILYIAPYVDKKIKEKRGFGSYQPAGNKKILGVLRSLEKGNNEVTVISPLLINKKQFKVFKKEEKKMSNSKLVYPSTINTAYLNFIITFIMTFFECAKWAVKKENRIIIAYNYRIETFLVAFAIKLLFRKKLVIEYEDGVQYIEEVNKVYKKIVSFIEKNTKKFIDGAILVNNNLSLHFDDIPLLTINGVFSKTDDLKNNKKSDSNEVVMYTGRLDHERGIDVFLNSIPKINSDLKNDISFVITGYGPYKNKVTNEVKLLSDKGYKVKYTGFLSDSELLETKKTATIFVNPQRRNEIFGDYSFPSKIFEYISFEKVIITSDVAGIKKLNDPRMFVIYENDSSDELATAIEKAASLSEKNTQELVSNAVTWAESFNVENLSQEINNFLKKL